MVRGADHPDELCSQWTGRRMEGGKNGREVPMVGQDRQMHQGGESYEQELNEITMDDYEERS
eukprot:447217-Heterocapsa_arctica.AAC.1